MTDLLTHRLHLSAEGIPTLLPPASEVRAGAEHDRRVRRTVAGTVVGAVLVIVTISLTSGTGRGLHTEPLPATSPTPTPGVYALSTDPLASNDGWAAFWGNGAPLPINRTDALPLMECIGDVHQLGASELHAATYTMGDGGSNNEYVLRFGDQARAASTFADLQDQFRRCHREQSTPAFLWPDQGYRFVAPHGPMDDMFEGEGTTTVQDQASGLRSGGYGVYAAREGNVVVLVESYGGWGDRTAFSLTKLLDKALGPDWATS